MTNFSSSVKPNAAHRRFSIPVRVRSGATEFRCLNVVGMRSTEPSAVNSALDAPHGTAGTGAAVGGSWTFLSNHAHVLLCLADDPHQTLPKIAARVGITSRAVQLIVSDLILGGYLTRTKVGRRNHYQINPDGHLRHPLEAHHRVADLISALGPTARS